MTAPTARSSSSRTAAAATRSPTPARTGQIGPNLDYAFLQSRRDGLGESTFVQVVRGQIAYPVVKPSTGAPGMPANIVEGQDADDVASYVGSVAGRRRSEPDDHAACDDDSCACRRWRRRRRERGRRQVGVRVGRLRELPHARRRRRDRHRRPEPRRREARRRAREGAGHERQGASMPSFKGQLTDAQIADVAAYVSSVAGK